MLGRGPGHQASVLGRCAVAVSQSIGPRAAHQGHRPRRRSAALTRVETPCISRARMDSCPALRPDLLLQLASLLVLTELAQYPGEVVGRDQRAGVVLAQDAAAAGEGVLMQCAGLLMLTQ